MGVESDVSILGSEDERMEEDRMEDVNEDA